jgi:prepilin-type processing-associated H-X9-DG protein
MSRAIFSTHGVNRPLGAERLRSVGRSRSSGSPQRTSAFGKKIKRVIGCKGCISLPRGDPYCAGGSPRRTGETIMTRVLTISLGTAAAAMLALLSAGVTASAMKSRHPGGMNVALMDGSVRTIPSGVTRIKVRQRGPTKHELEHINFTYEKIVWSRARLKQEFRAAR